MSDVLLAIGLAVLGAIFGWSAWFVSEKVLSERDDPPPPPAQWGQWAAIAWGIPVTVLIGLEVGERWILPAYLWFVWATLALTFTDLRSRLIPDRISFRSIGIGAVLLVAGGLIEGSTNALTRAGVGALIAVLVYLLIFIAGRGRSFGFGDVKLSPLLGMFMAFASWGVFMLSIVMSFVIGGVIGVLLLVLRLKKMQEHFAFGPPMIVAAYVALLWGAEIVEWYLPAN